jgi:hypothetical protein
VEEDISISSLVEMLLLQDRMKMKKKGEEEEQEQKKKN